MRAIADFAEHVFLGLTKGAMSVLVVAEHGRGGLSSSVHHAVTAAVELAFITASEVHVLVLGSRCGEVAEAAAEISGVLKVICAGIASEVGALPSIVDVISTQYRHVVFAATPESTLFAEQMASMLGVKSVQNVVKVVSENAFEIMGEMGQALVWCRDRVVVITAEIAGFQKAACFGHASIEMLAVKPMAPPV